MKILKLLLATVSLLLLPLEALCQQPATVDEKLDTLLTGFSCELPVGFNDFQPLLGIAPGDRARETLAREYIELYRRRGGWRTWDDAALSFFASQSRLAYSRGWLVEYPRRAKWWVDLKKKV
jgi:hypothetical protein